MNIFDLVDDLWWLRQRRYLCLIRLIQLGGHCTVVYIGTCYIKFKKKSFSVMFRIKVLFFVKDCHLRYHWTTWKQENGINSWQVYLPDEECDASQVSRRKFCATHFALPIKKEFAPPPKENVKLCHCYTVIINCAC